MPDDPAVLLSGPGEESRHVHQRHEGQVERIAEADEPGSLGRRVDVEGPRERRRIVGDDADRAAGEPGEPDHEVGRPVALDLKERLRVEQSVDDRMDIVGRARLLGHDPGQLGGRRIARGDRRADRRLLEIVEWEIGEQSTGERQRVPVGGRGEVGDPALGGVRVGPAERLHRHLFPGHGLHDVGAGDEHLAGALGHDHEVGDRGRVDGPAGARTEHEGDLRDDARQEHVPEEDLAVAAEAHHALLDPGAARVVQADDRHARPCGAVSITFTIFIACASPSAPPKTVASWAKAQTGRSLTSPQPVTTPSPGILLVGETELIHAVGDERVDR